MAQKIDCSLTENFFKERIRMCSSFDICDQGCPIYYAMQDDCTEEMCADYINGNIQKVIKIVQEWSNDNPIITNLDYFLRHFPNAKLTNNRASGELNTPIEVSKPCSLGLVERRNNVNGVCFISDHCYLCWYRPYEDK